ncbi:MAG TPA: rhomboid family intramembrane serine protease [Terracidiphilus sp.]|nr:rhomboid family intramembrane serine protease [Terracidiphilus sp.]
MGGLIPLGDASRRTLRRPVVTGVIIAVNIYVFLKELLYGDAFVAQWSAIPAQITSGRHLITLFTSMFMHGGWMHIIGNMVFLWAFGPEIEDAMGRARYLIFYLLGGTIAMFAQVLANPTSTIPNLGASGAIAAVMGAFIVTYPRDRIKTVLFIAIFWRVTFIPASLLIGFWILIQVIDAGAVVHVQRGGVAYLAHIGGFLFGVITARWFEDKRRLAWIESEG